MRAIIAPSSGAPAGTLKAMFWLQGFLCFILWIGYGIFQVRRKQSLADKIATQSRGRRTLTGALWMLFGAAVLFGSLMGIQWLGGFTPNGMSMPAWILIAFSGLAFVHAQTYAMSAMATLLLEGNVTSNVTVTSDSKGSDATQL